MKIIDEKGKLFKLINIVDLLIIVCIVGAIATISSVLFSSVLQNNMTQTQTMTTVVRIRGATTFMQEELLRNSIIGEQMIAGTDYVDAWITDVEFVDYELQTTNSDGVVVNVVDPVRKDIIVTMVSEVSATTPILKIGTQEIRAGRTMYIKTREFETSGSIQSVILDDTNN